MLAKRGDKGPTVQEFLEPTRAGRIKAIVFYAVLGAFWISERFFLQPFFKEKLAQPLCDALPWTRIVVIHWFVIFLLLVAGLVRASILTLRSGQIPFPGAIFVFRARVIRGWRAQLSGYLFATMALSIIGGMIWVWAFLDLGYIFCLYEACTC